MNDTFQAFILVSFFIGTLFAVVFLIVAISDFIDYCEMCVKRRKNLKRKRKAEAAMALHKQRVAKIRALRKQQRNAIEILREGGMSQFVLSLILELQEKEVALLDFSHAVNGEEIRAEMRRQAKARRAPLREKRIMVRKAMLPRRNRETVQRVLDHDAASMSAAEVQAKAEQSMLLLERPPAAAAREKCARCDARLVPGRDCKHASPWLIMQSQDAE